MRRVLTAALTVLCVVLTPAGIAAASSHPRVNWFPRGQCTRYAYIRRPDIVDVTVARTHASAWDAKDWAANAAGAGFRVDGTPHPGDIAVWSAGLHGAGPQGHVAFVEWVGRARIRISEVNFNGRPDKTTRRLARSALGGVQFIHHLA